MTPPRPHSGSPSPWSGGTSSRSAGRPPAGADPSGARDAAGNRVPRPSAGGAAATGGRASSPASRVTAPARARPGAPADRGTSRRTPTRTGSSAVPGAEAARTGTTRRSPTPAAHPARPGTGTAPRTGDPRSAPARSGGAHHAGAPRRATTRSGTPSRTGGSRAATAGTARTGGSRAATAGTARTGASRGRVSAPRPARPGRSVRAGGGGRPPRRPGGRRMVRLGDPGRRLGVGFAAVCTLLVILGGRLVQLQGFDSEHLAAKAEQRRLYPTTIPALRGSVVDRDGQLLAYSVAARTIHADPKLVEDPAATAAALAGPLGKSVDWLLPRLTKKNSRYVVLAKDVSPRDAATALAFNRAGISADDTTQRIYPGHDLAAAVVGYTNEEGGLGGIESKFQPQLAGTDGQLEVERGSNGLQIPGGIRQETAAVPGSTVQLTIDQDLQFMLQRSLSAAVGKAKASTGQAVILNVHTGEVLAMATTPTYDAQNPSASPPAARTNLAVQAPVEPGSANKVVTFAAALDRGTLRPDTPLLVPDSIKVADRYVHDAWSHAPTKWTATGVLAKSSNVGTLMIAENRLGPALFYDYEKRFGIGTRTGIELPGESPGILPAPDTWSGSTFGNLPIGQGLSMTPLQLAGMYQTIANDGVRVQPRIIKGVLGPDGTTTPTTPAERVAVVSPEAARAVRGMLEAVVQKGGTAPKAAIDNYRVAGKTGTAQRPNPACKCYSGGGYWATFAGIAPADRPELVMSVVIEEPPGGGEGGAVAAPLFHDVMSYALTARKVTPTGTPVPTPKLTVD